MLTKTPYKRLYEAKTWSRNRRPLKYHSGYGFTKTHGKSWLRVSLSQALGIDCIVWDEDGLSWPRSQQQRPFTPTLDRFAL